MLVARRHRYTGEVSYFRCHAPGPVALATLVETICRRWKTEETFQLAKGLTGLDQGQVTCWNSWMRWPSFSLIAAARSRHDPAYRDTRQYQTADPSRPADLPRTRTSPTDLLLPPPTRDREHALRWTAWRRRHQATAQACHQQRHHV